MKAAELPGKHPNKGKIYDEERKTLREIPDDQALLCSKRNLIERTSSRSVDLPNSISNIAKKMKKQQIPLAPPPNPTPMP